MPRAPLQRLPDWLVVGQERWDEGERRNQLLVRALAARHPRSRFLFAELPLRARDLRAWRLPRLRRVAPNVWAIRPIRPFPGPRLQPLSDRIEAAQLRGTAKTLGIERPMLWTQDPRAAALIDRLPACGLVYDLTDDWAAFETDPDRRANVQQRVETLARKADLVLACSRPLADMARPWSDNVRYLPNAVEAPTATADEPEALRDLPRPRLGYIGTLHSSRLDVDLLAQTAELRPAWSFVLLGPNALSAADTERLLRLPNVHYLGARPHSEVRGYVEALDVCLLPHLVTPFTNSLDPLKLYEYLASRRPSRTLRNCEITLLSRQVPKRSWPRLSGQSPRTLLSANPLVARPSPARRGRRAPVMSRPLWPWSLRRSAAAAWPSSSSVAAIEHGLSNARVEAINTQIRMLTRRAFGFHSPDALIALAMLCLSGLCPPLPR